MANQNFEYQIPTAEKPKKRHGCLITFLIFVVIIALLAIGSPYAIKELEYRTAQMCVDQGEYDTALFMYSSLDTYRDAKEKLVDTKYLKAQALAEDGDYEYAIEILQEIEPYEESRDLTEDYIAQYISQLLEDDKYDEAVAYLESVDGIDGSEDMKIACEYYDAVADYEAQDYYNAVLKFEKLGKYEESEKYLAMSNHHYLVMMGYGNSAISAQKEVFKSLKKYSDDDKSVAEMLVHPIYNPMKFRGEWETEDGLVLKYTDDVIQIGIPNRIAGRNYLTFNGDYVCATDVETREEKRVFKILNFNEPEDESPSEMVILNEYDQKEYTFKRVK